MHSKGKNGGILSSLGNRMRLLNILGNVKQSVRTDSKPEKEIMKCNGIDTVEPLDLDFSDRDLVAFPEYCDKSLLFYKTKSKSDGDIDVALKFTRVLDDEIPCDTKEDDDLTKIDTEDEYFDDFENTEYISRFNFSSNPDFSRLCFDYGSPENSPKLPSKHSHTVDSVPRSQSDTLFHPEVRSKLERYEFPNILHFD